MAQMPDVTAVWRRDGDHFTRVSPVRWDLMTTGASAVVRQARRRSWSTPRRADYGPDLIATLPDNTTYSVAGDHGGIQRAAQQIPIVFAGAGLSSKDVHGRGPVGRHHADDPARRWGSRRRPHGRRRLPAAAGEVALAGRLPKGGPVGLGWCVMQPSESDRAALQFIAEGVTELAGFEVAAISVVRDGVLHTVAVAGDDERERGARRRWTPGRGVLAELENAEDWGPLKFVPHEREGSAPRRLPVDPGPRGRRWRPTPGTRTTCCARCSRTRRRAARGALDRRTPRRQAARTRAAADPRAVRAAGRARRHHRARARRVRPRPRAGARRGGVPRPAHRRALPRGAEPARRRSSTTPSCCSRRVPTTTRPCAGSRRSSAGPTGSR